jgi:hypothetical protein
MSWEWRRSHYLLGPNNVDWIFRNQLIADRESSLYVPRLGFSPAFASQDDASVGRSNTRKCLRNAVAG